MVRAIILLAACCATALAQREPASLQRARGECGRPGSGSRTKAEPDSLWEPGSKIVGGKPALNQAWPWIGALIQAKPGYWPYQFCGGTLISDQWFVTAGHCVDSLSDEDIVNNVQIYMGTNDLTKTPSNKKFRVSRVIKHPQYDQPEGSTNNDIALLKLAKPVAFDSSIKPACLPQRPLNDTSRAFPTHFDKANGNRRVAFVAGWGHTSEGQRRPYNGDGSDAPPLGAGSDILQQVAIAMYEPAVCKGKLRGYTYSDKMLCGGFEQGGKDSCQGDSGGPLVAKNSEGAYELIGIVSWGAGCARASMPGIYAYVHALREWIYENIAKN